MDNQTEQLANLMRRVEDLERRTLRYKRLSLAVGMLAGVSLLMAAVRPSAAAVEAEKFVLREPNGKPQAVLEIGADGPRFAIMTKDGQEKVVMALKKDENPFLALRSKDGSKQLILGMADIEQAIVFEDRGVNRMVVATDNDGDALIVLKDREGRLRTMLSGFPGDAGLLVSDVNRKNRVRLILDQKGPKLELLDEEGKPLFVQPGK